MSISLSPEGPKPGWIYCIANPASPGLVKIGCTSQTVDQRMAELDTTGVAMPFALLGKWLSADIRRDEKAVHRMFAAQRTRQGREWFEVENADLIDMVCAIGAHMTQTNGAFYMPPTHIRELEASTWLMDLGITDHPISITGNYEEYEPNGFGLEGRTLRTVSLVAMICLGSIFLSVRILGGI